MAQKKFQWPTESGASTVTYPADLTPNEVVALQPQRIRVFRVEFTPKNGEFLQ